MQTLDKKYNRCTGLWWAMFDWARSPYYYIVVVYIFSTYFSETVVGEGSKGQSVVSLTVTLAGIITAILTPIVGVLVDKGGRKKPVLFGLMLVLSICAICLQFVKPDVGYAIPLGMTLLIIGGCCYSFSELLHNAMLPGAGDAKSVPMISGLGLSLGALSSVIFLIAIAYVLFNLPDGFEQTDIARLSSAAVGIWVLIFMVFFFWKMPDVYVVGQTWRGAIKDFMSPQADTPGLFAHIADLFKEFPNIMRFLIARMLFMDALTAVFTIGAVYVAGVLGWNTLEIAAMGVLATVSAVFGGVLGGLLDRKFGPRNAILIELGIMCLIFTFQLSINDNSILFGLIPADGVSEREMFSRSVDIIYIVSIIPLATLIISIYSSCRSLLVRLSPEDRIGEFFGIYAMTSSVTVWLGPALVTVATLMTQNQRLGFASLMILFLAGFFIMLKVQPNRAELS